MKARVSVLTLFFFIAELSLGGELMGDWLEVSGGVTQIYQSNVKGGLSTSRHKGRYTGSYDLEISGDLERGFGAQGLSFYMLMEGSWPDAAGIDEFSVGSYFGVNDDAASNRSIDITELWFEQQMMDGDVLLRVGKIDLTGGFQCKGCPVGFDSSMYANDETSQFLNSSLVNNSTIPFPDNGLAVAVFYTPVDRWYFSAAAADAQADARETGFSTAFGEEDYFVYLFETGFVNEADSENGPLVRAFRAGLWYDPQPKSNSDSSKLERDDMGFYLSLDQQLSRENSEADDSQGLGSFFRYGYAHSETNDMSNFVSFGFQYTGLLEGRDADVMGVGYSQGFFSDSADASYTNDYESVVEVYYNAQVMSNMNVTPSVQYVKNPGGQDAIGDAVVFGLRSQISF